MYSAKEFWNWFQSNNEAFIFLNQVDEEEKSRLLYLFEKELHKYCDKLWFEIGGHPDETQEIIITAEGNVDYFKHVNDLIKEAPPLKNWKYIAFKPPMGVDFEIIFEGVELKPTEMWFLPMENADDKSLVGFSLAIKDFESIKKNEWAQTAIMKILDTVLGEKIFALDVDHFEMEELPDDPAENGMYELSKLLSYVEEHKNKKH